MPPEAHREQQALGFVRGNALDELATTEFVIGATLHRSDPTALEAQGWPMGLKVKLKRQEGKALKYGPVRFHADGTISVGETKLALSAIPETGLNLKVAKIFRSGADLIAVRTKDKMMVFCFAHGCWYHGDPEEA